MNKKIYVRYDTSEGSSWASCLEGLNSFTNTEEFDISSLRKYQQIIDYYYRFDNNKMRVFKTVSDDAKNFLSVGIPSRTKDQTICIAAVDTEIIFNALQQTKYDVVYFAYKHVEGDSTREIDLMEKSKFYSRNVLSGLVENVETGEHFTEERFSMSIWYAVYRMGDSDIYYLVVNPNLLMMIEDITGTHNDIDYRVINTHDGNMRNAVFKPAVSDGTLIGDNIIYTTSDEVTIDVFGNSSLHGFGTKINKLDSDELPNIELGIESSTKYKREKDKIVVDMTDQKLAYIKYTWYTKTPLDYFFTGEEKLEYSFVIMKG